MKNYGFQFFCVSKNNLTTKSQPKQMIMNIAPCSDRYLATLF